jgi:hypothetical protein
VTTPDAPTPADGRAALLARLRRRPALVALALLVVAAIVVAAVVLGTGGERPDSDAASASSSASTSAVTSAPSSSVPSPTTTAPAPSGPTGDPNDPPPSRPAVALSDTAEAGDGVTASLPLIEEIDGHAVGPGNVSGPALRITVRVTNGTHGAVSLDGVSVNVAYGSELTPASPLEDSSADPFTGSLAPGASAQGVYVFSVPEGSRDSVTIEVGYQAGAPLLLFTGPVG